MTPLNLFLQIAYPLFKHILQDSNKYNVTKEINLKPLTMTEVLCYFMVLFAMGLNKEPAINCYWKTENDLYGCYYIQKLMSKTTFWNINSIIHCDIDELIKLMNQFFQTYWYPFQHVAVDESIIAYKGFLIFNYN